VHSRLAPSLIVLRGNSASGKTSVAREVRHRYGRGCALVEQDYLRRVILREHDSSQVPGIAPDFIDNTVRFALSRGYHVVLEGILADARYGPVLRALVAGHRGPSHVFYLDVSLAETLRRHRSRPLGAEVADQLLHEWYLPFDTLGVAGERVIPESSTFEESVTTVLDSLADAPANTPCPVLCPRCRAERG
jgi:predicted kinase